MDELPEIDDDVVQTLHDRLAQKQMEKEMRVCAGELASDLATGPRVSAEEVAAAPTLAEREVKWGFSVDELQIAAKVVRRLFADPSLFQNDPWLAETRLYTMISRDRGVKRQNRETYRRIMKEEKSRHTQEIRRYDESVIAKTKMRQERDESLRQLLQPPSKGPAGGAPLSITEGPATTSTDRGGGEVDENSIESDLTTKRLCTCHICKSKYTVLHRYYYALCPPCGDFNYQKRIQTRDLSGKFVLLTGCRIKIGYEMALSLLRCGAEVIGTSRFVHDALGRFCQEKDFSQWSHRLHLFALDLRDLWMVNNFCAFLRYRFFAPTPQNVEGKPHRLFAIINNAAQTIARPPEYSRNLRAGEVSPPSSIRDELSSRRGDWEWMAFALRNSALTIGQSVSLEPRSSGGACGLLGDAPREPTTDGVSKGALVGALRLKISSSAPSFDRYDTAAEVSDRREKNSWTLQLHEVPPVEASEVMAINALAPFVLNSRLKPAMIDVGEERASGAAFIINVSAMEGQFYRFKQTTHPHTNMAKASLNMMTRTSAEDYAKSNIFMNAVDTGWITDESPIILRQRRLQQSEAQLCPLDEVDAAARCLDLIYTDSREYGQFWKNYAPIPW